MSTPLPAGIGIARGPREPCASQIFRTYGHLCFERRYHKQNSVIRLKSNILSPKKIFGSLKIFGLAMPLRQSNSRLGNRQKNLMTPIPTRESENFSLLTLTSLPTPPFASGLSNLFALYQIIKHEKIRAVFPSVETILILFLCLMVTNCSGERSFSKLKRIKNVLRPTMSQERLSDLRILCVENDKLRLIDFDCTIDDFAARKARRKMICH